MNISPSVFSRYQKWIIAILAILQFTIVLDFMVLSPLSAILLPELEITTAQFGWVVSAYAFSAGISGFLAAGFADRYDRKKLLLFFYTGFILGTLLCGLAQGYILLLSARIITGIFGGVIGSISYAIISDLFAIEVRGRVMGYVQMAFASSQVLGLPVGLYLASRWDWHFPFLFIVAISCPLMGLIIWIMKPVDEHLQMPRSHSAIKHLKHVLVQKRYIKGFGATTLLATGGFMLMPFGAAFAVGNLGISLEQLPLVYFLTGLTSMIGGPLLGRLTDRIGTLKMFIGGSILTLVLVIFYTRMEVTPLWLVITLNCLLFLGVTSRLISSSTLTTAIPAPQDRGAFMGINSSVAQLSGGIASASAGFVVFQSASGHIMRYDVLGLIVASTMIITMFMIFRIYQEVIHEKVQTG